MAPSDCLWARLARLARTVVFTVLATGTMPTFVSRDRCPCKYGVGRAQSHQHCATADSYIGDVTFSGFPGRTDTSQIEGHLYALSESLIAFSRTAHLHAGDADMDYDIDQLDIIGMMGRCLMLQRTWTLLTGG